MMPTPFQKTNTTRAHPIGRANKGFREKASSLVITLLVITVLTIIVVAFMQTMALERTTAKSYRDIEQARLAAEAGVSMAVTQLTLAVGTNQAFVTGQTNFPNTNYALTVIGRTNLTNRTQLMPLVSGPTNLLASFALGSWSSNDFATYAGLRTNTNPSVSVDVNTPKNYIHVTNNSNLYRASWITNTVAQNGQTNYIRFAYVILDEHARLNPLLHTGRGTGLANPTNWYSGPQDIQLTNASFPILSPQQGEKINTNITAYRNSQDSIGQAIGNRSQYDSIKHLLTVSDNPTFDIIPAWLRDGGKPKYNINDLATNTTYGATPTDRATNIAGIINSNLTNFSSRDPSLRTSVTNRIRYLNRLAANIVDYIDEDSNPTSVNNGEPAGKDLFPLVVAVAERFRRKSFTPITPTTGGSVEIESQCFVQLWNPYTSDIKINGSLRFALRNRMRLTFGTGIVTPFQDYDQTIPNINLTIRPNEYVVVEFPTVTQTWTAPPGNPSTPGWANNSPADAADQTTHLPFEFYVDGHLADMSRRFPMLPTPSNSGLARARVTFSNTANVWQCNFVPSFSGGGGWRAVGDPRSNFLSNYDWEAITSYNSTLWKGRQNSSGSRQQDLTATWVNRDYVPRNPSVGTAPGNVNTTPASVASGYKTSDASAAIAFLRNGPMHSIGELGHVFDPIHADDSLAAPVGGSGINRSTSISAGGRTLRIGQTDFSTNGNNTWNTNGRRAIELLDLFTVNPTNFANGGARGRININTAPMEVLAATLAGITINSDQGIPERKLTNLANMARTIITNRPYQALSDLHKIVPIFAASTNYSPSFTTSVGGGTTNIAAVDRVREEAFGKWVQHVTVQSRTYRVYVVGQALDGAQRIKGTSVMEVTVFLDYDETQNKFIPIIQNRRVLQ